MQKIDDRSSPNRPKSIGKPVDLAAGAGAEGVDCRAPRALAGAGKTQILQFFHDKCGLRRGVDTTLRRGKARTDPFLQLTQGSAEGFQVVLDHRG